MFKGLLAKLVILSGYILLVHSAVTKRSQCQSILNTAATVANRLQSHSFSPILGNYIDGELWTDANTIENLINLMLAAGTDTYANVITESNLGRWGSDTSTNWESILDGSWDDAQWVILMLWKIADYQNAHGQNASPFMVNAGRIYDIVSTQWDDTCGGGVWWSSAHTYKNAVTNQLYITTSANGFLRTGNQTYLNNAQKTWTWLSNSGMRNSQGLYNDGLDSSTCANNGQTTWIYNQGVIASGLAALASATGDSSLYDQAEITLDAAISLLTVNDILKESCDDAAAGGAQCNHDQQSFKGIWTKHVQYYLDVANSASRTAKYSTFLGSQTSAVFHFGTNSNNDVGSVWYAPDQGGSVFTPESSSSGLAAHVAAAKYGPC